MTYQNRFTNETYSAHDFFNNGNGIITLCGSTKFFVECMEINRRLTFDGWIVLMCGSWGHSYHQHIEGNSGISYKNVKTLHYKKILMSDAVVVVTDKSNYVGNSTKAEVQFCKQKNIPIFYFDGEHLTGSTQVELPSTLEKYNSVIDEYIESGGSLGF